ncbi:MAG: DNA-binding protein [Rhizobiales bacterium]|nr:DNA-binding protein [Hyphomicrobiales bacterium]
MSDEARWIPVPTPETRHFWDGARRGELVLQRCGTCDHVYFPPRPFCSSCWSRDVRTFTASGKGLLASYVISHRAVPGFDPPYSVAIVVLEEGPRMISNIVGCEQTPEALRIDMPLEVVFTRISDEIVLPQFQPRVDHR